jgi:hypothetical protein
MFTAAEPNNPLTDGTFEIVTRCNLEILPIIVRNGGDARRD